MIMHAYISQNRVNLPVLNVTIFNARWGCYSVGRCMNVKWLYLFLYTITLI